MKYFHVLSETAEGADQKRTVEAFKDLSEKELKSQFIKPFRQGSDFMIKGQKYTYGKVQGVRICKTEKKNEEIKEASYNASTKRVDEMNSQHDNPFYFVSPCTPIPEDIFDFGEEVTSSYDLSKKSNSVFGQFFERIDRVVFSVLAIIAAGIILYYLGFK